VSIHRGDVILGSVHEQHVLTRPGERGPGHATDGAGSVHRDRHGHSLEGLAKMSNHAAIGAACQ